jgi:hypothetical protein
VVARGDYAANSGATNENYSQQWGPDSGASNSSENADIGFTGWLKEVDSNGKGLLRGISYVRSTVKPSMVKDGTSHTIMIGEKYLDSLHYTDSVDYSDTEPLYMGYQDDTSRTAIFSSSIDLDNPGLDPNLWLRASLTPSTTYSRDIPGVQKSLAFGSAHAQGANFIFCDGAIHSINYNVAPYVLAFLIYRDDKRYESKAMESDDVY